MLLPTQAHSIPRSSSRSAEGRILPSVGLVDTTTRTDRQWLDETCLDASRVPNLHHVTLDQSWHPDGRAAQYGNHLTFSLYDSTNNRLDTCHAYQWETNDGCLVTFCQNNYAGFGVPDGNGFYGYLADTH